MKQQKSAKNLKYLLSLKILLFLNIICLLYFILPSYSKSVVLKRINSQLFSIKEAMEEYIKDFGTTPDSYSELEIYSKYKNKNIDYFDSTGEAFQYIKLSSSHYVVRSFGLDGIQNTLSTEQDLLTAHWNSLDISSPHYKYQSQPALKMFAAPILLGMSSFDNRWHAQIYYDPTSGKRQLLVRYKQKQGFFLLAFHDFVEEFFWLPDSKKIIFTATSSLRYPDGIYLWDVEKDSVINLINSNTHSSIVGETSDTKSYYLSLAGINSNGKDIYAYILPKHSNSLNPQKFFNFKSLYKISIDLDKNKDLDTLVSKGGVKISSLFYLSKNPRFSPVPSIMQDEGGEATNNKIYRVWKKLPLKGDAEQVLLSWQNFANATSETLIFPYCLWYLSVLYSDAFRLAISKAPESSDPLRALSLELSRSLAYFEMAPAYLRGFGVYGYESLMEGEPLSYKLSNLSIGKKKIDIFNNDKKE